MARKRVHTQKQRSSSSGSRQPPRQFTVFTAGVSRYSRFLLWRLLSHPVNTLMAQQMASTLTCLSASNSLTRNSYQTQQLHNNGALLAFKPRVFCNKCCVIGPSGPDYCVSLKNFILFVCDVPCGDPPQPALLPPSTHPHFLSAIL